MPFDPKTVPVFKIKETSVGSIDIVKKENRYALYNKGEQWMVLNGTDQEIKELYSSYDLAYGNVLMTGLGFGILALWLCNKPEVTSVTVLEISQEVVDIFKESNATPEKLSIITADASLFTTNIEYDCLLLDHYEPENDSWKLENIREICSKIKHKAFWSWSLEPMYLKTWLTHEQYLKHINCIFDAEYAENPFIDGPDLSIEWESFIETHLPQEKSLKLISPKKLNEYIYTFFNQDNLIQK